jgi:putative ATP-dependent endonuclease of the OLD family
MDLPMARIRKLEIQHFRGIQEFTWLPESGINCLIGPGDSGKSSVLDAIDFCLGARRSIQFTDADFHALDTETPISISVTLGDLDDALKNLDAYGLYVGSFDPKGGDIGEEPETGKETVLTVNLAVGSDLEPNWTLLSKRAKAQGLTRNLNWADRIRLAPTRIGVMADYRPRLAPTARCRTAPRGRSLRRDCGFGAARSARRRVQRPPRLRLRGFYAHVGQA